MTRKKQQVGIVSQDYGQALDLLLLEEGTSLARYIPGWANTPDDDYARFYKSRIKYCHNDLDVIKGSDFCIVDPVILGAYEKFVQLGVPTVGTPAVARQLESDRQFAKWLAKKVGISVPRSWTAHSLSEAKTIIKANGGKLVLKPGDHLTADFDLRTVIPQNSTDLLSLMESVDYFKDNGNVIFEQLLDGVEVCVAGWFNGSEFLLPYYLAFEHKASSEGQNRGVLTGEVGTILFYDFDTTLHSWEILNRFTPYLKQCNYRGLFDLNCMLTREGKLFLLEFTTRFGYPTLYETASVVPPGMTKLLRQVAYGESKNLPITSDWVCGVCAYAYGAPLVVDLWEKCPTFEIQGIEQARTIADVRLLDVIAQADGKIHARWGDRSLVVNGTGETLNEACDQAYNAIDQIKYWGMTYRRDIGNRLRNGAADLLYRYKFINEKRYHQF